jgi:hypothetical protein
MNKNWFRPKYVVFANIFWMMVYVLDHTERFVIHSSDPIWDHYQSFKWWLLPHAVAGACALFLGPMQFSDWLRHRYAKMSTTVIGLAFALSGKIQQHRQWMTRSYAVAIVFLEVSPCSGDEIRERQSGARTYLVGPSLTARAGGTTRSGESFLVRSFLLPSP